MGKQTNSRLRAVEEAVKLGGGVGVVAKKLKVDQTTVSQWLLRGQVSQHECLKLHKLSGVDLWRLRPDLYPRILFT